MKATHQPDKKGKKKKKIKTWD